MRPCSLMGTGDLWRGAESLLQGGVSLSRRLPDPFGTNDFTLSGFGIAILTLIGMALLITFGIALLITFWKAILLGAILLGIAVVLVMGLLDNQHKPVIIKTSSVRPQNSPSPVTKDQSNKCPSTTPYVSKSSAWLRFQDELEDRGWQWAEDEIARRLGGVSNQKKTGDGGVDILYHGMKELRCQKRALVPIQVKMHQKSPGRIELDKLLGVQASMNNRGQYAPISVLVTLHPSSPALQAHAHSQGKVNLTFIEGQPESYPRLQVISMKEILLDGKKVHLPPRTKWEA